MAFPNQLHAVVHRVVGVVVLGRDVISAHFVEFAVCTLVVAVVIFVIRSWNRAPKISVDLLADVDLRNAKRVATTALTIDSRPGMIQCYAPGTLTFLGEIPVSTADDVKAVVAKARAAQAVWAKTSFSERRRVLRCMQAAILSHSDQITAISCIDTGKTRVDAQFGEILSTLGKLDWVAAEGEPLLKPESRPTNFMTYTMAKKARLEYIPLGVIGVIAPWNYPCYNLFNHIASGLFSGNAVVSKISEYSAWSGQKYIRLAQEALIACGHNPDLVQLVQGFGETGAALVNSTDKVIFTGSPGVGKLVMKGASSSLTPLVLELGGKDPIIITEDVSIDTVLPVTLRGVFQNAGQNCVGIERVLVAEGIYDAFVEKAAAAVNALRVGPTFTVDPATGKPLFSSSVDVGAVTTAPQLSLIQALVDDAVSKGAKLLAGGKVLFSGEGQPSSSSPTSSGLFYSPTLLADVTPSMRIATEEVFGPVMCVMKVQGNSDDRAVEIANGTKYGLGASVFSRSPSRAENIAKRLKCGMVGVNSFGLNYLVQSLPFGGVGESGFERFSGAEGLRSCCYPKSMVVDAFSLFSVPMSVPGPLQYPVAPHAPTFTGGLLTMLFGGNLFSRIGGMMRLAAAPLIKVQQGPKGDKQA